MNSEQKKQRLQDASQEHLDESENTTNVSQKNADGLGAWFIRPLDEEKSDAIDLEPDTAADRTCPNGLLTKSSDPIVILFLHGKNGTRADKQRLVAK